MSADPHITMKDPHFVMKVTTDAAAGLETMVSGVTEDLISEDQDAAQDGMIAFCHQDHQRMGEPRPEECSVLTE